MMKIRRRLVLALVAVSLLAMGLGVQAGFEPPIIETVIYPDGLAYLVREGEIAPENGECVLDLLPPALSGSLKVYSPNPGLVLEQVVASRDQVLTEQPIADLPELFRENTGKSIRLSVHGEVVTGVVKGFVDPAYVVVGVTNPKGNNVDEIYPLDLISSYHFLEPVKLHKEKTDYTGKLRLRFREAAFQGGAYPVGISYLQHGLAWSPEYIINLQSENSGELSFSGVVTNEAADLVNTTVYLAEKGPQFPPGLSPLVIFSPGEDTVARRGQLTVMGVQSEKMSYAANLETVETASLIMYKTRNPVTLKKGERILLPLFRGAVRAESLYQVRLFRPLYSTEVAVEPVWKVYRIYNNSSIPWIDGRVMLTMADRPLGMGEFPYIAPNQSGEIKVMTEPGINVTAKEVEFERIQGQMVVQGTEYAFVRIRGEIEVENTKDTEIKLKVSHQVPGEVTAIGEGGAAAKKAVLQAGPNPTSELDWEVRVWPQGKSKLTYTYQTYLPLEKNIR